MKLSVGDGRRGIVSV